MTHGSKDSTVWSYTNTHQVRVRYSAPYPVRVTRFISYRIRFGLEGTHPLEPRLGGVGVGMISGSAAMPRRRYRPTRYLLCMVGGSSTTERSGSIALSSGHAAAPRSYSYPPAMLVIAGDLRNACADSLGCLARPSAPHLRPERLDVHTSRGRAWPAGHGQSGNRRPRCALTVSADGGSPHSPWPMRLGGTSCASRSCAHVDRCLRAVCWPLGRAVTPTGPRPAHTTALHLPRASFANSGCRGDATMGAPPGSVRRHPSRPAPPACPRRRWREGGPWTR